MKRQTKAKAEVRKASPDPSQGAMVVHCLQDLGTRCASFGRQGNVNEVMTVLSNTHQSLQLHLQKMTSVERARKRRREEQKEEGRSLQIVERGFQFLREALRVSRTKGENHLPLAQLQYA